MGERTTQTLGIWLIQLNQSTAILNFIWVPEELDSTAQFHSVQL